MIVNACINENGTLLIFCGNALIAEIENGEQDEHFINDILFSMGYKWHDDGSITKTE